MKLTRKLKELHGRVVAALPNVTVCEHPYDIGYWAYRAKIEIPASVARYSDLAELKAGVEQAKSDTGFGVTCDAN